MGFGVAQAEDELLCAGRDRDTARLSECVGGTDARGEREAVDKVVVLEREVWVVLDRGNLGPLDVLASLEI